MQVDFSLDTRRFGVTIGFQHVIGSDFMKMKTSTSICLTAAMVGVFANFVLWRYRLHLYELNADYEREPLHHIQLILFRGTEALVLLGAVLYSCRRFFSKG
jgi:hypothetical protein